MKGNQSPSQGASPMGHGVVLGGSKAKNFKSSFMRLMGYFKPRKFRLMFVVLLSILSTIFMVISPKILGNTTTLIASGVASKLQGGLGVDFNTVGTLLTSLTLAYILSAFFAYLQQYLMSDIAQKTVFTLRSEVDAKLAPLPLQYFDTHATGDILSIVTNDVDNISNTLQQSLTQFITSMITIIGVIIMMLTISPLLTLIILVTLPLGVLVIRPIVNRSQKFFSGQQDYLGNLNGHIEEMYTGHKVVKAFGHEPTSIEEFTLINDKLYAYGWKAQFLSGLIMPLMMFVNNIGYVVITVVGGILVTKGSINIGDIQAFIQYSRQFTQPINQLANIANILQSTVASAERVFEFLDATEEISDANACIVLENPKGNVAFNHVKFGYEPEHILMKDVNVDVKKGQTIAIVGPTGAGKTTMINLLMRFYELNDGAITIDGVDITHLKRSHLRQLFGMVLQDTWLFKGSIRDNIAYGKDNATDEEVIAAAKAASADHFIRTLPQGYDTELNEEASNISQGQKQLLTIARAILANPVILILDEATSSVDTRTESYIQNAMTRLMEGRTNFVIAHRLSTIKDADMILVMKAGDVIEKGTHEELLARKGLYADLYNSQFDHSA